MPPSFVVRTLTISLVSDPLDHSKFSEMKLSILWSATVFSALVDAISLTTESGSYTVNAGSANSLQFVVSRTNCDITSILYRGAQLQYTSQGSHIGSGLGSSTTVTAQELTSKLEA